MSTLAWTFVGVFCVGFVCGILVAWIARAAAERHRAATLREPLPPPDTIEARNARGIARWHEQTANRRRET